LFPQKSNLSDANAAKKINDVGVEVVGFYPHGGASTPRPTPGPPTPATTNNDCVDFIWIQHFRSCKWAGNESTTQRCVYDGASEACPLTCGTCDSCVDTPSSLRFSLRKNGAIINRSCDWVTRKQIASCCTQTDNICRASCDVCQANYKITTFNDIINCRVLYICLIFCQISFQSYSTSTTKMSLSSFLFLLLFEYCQLPMMLKCMKGYTFSMMVHC
jgi:hypothetical protein